MRPGHDFVHSASFVKSHRGTRLRLRTRRPSMTRSTSMYSWCRCGRKSCSENPASASGARSRSSSSRQASAARPGALMPRARPPPLFLRSPGCASRADRRYQRCLRVLSRGTGSFMHGGDCGMPPPPRRTPARYQVLLVWPLSRPSTCDRLWSRSPPFLRARAPHPCRSAGHSLTRSRSSIRVLSISGTITYAPPKAFFFV
jgi:hypothetical protein